MMLHCFWDANVLPGRSHWPHHPHAQPHSVYHGPGHPPQHLLHPGPSLHHQHPPRPPHPSLQHDDLRRREATNFPGLTLPPIHAYHPHPRPPSPGSSNSSARGSPVLRPVVYPPPLPPPRHPHHLPPTSSLRSTHALSIDTVPTPPAQGQGLAQNLAARLLALAAGGGQGKVVDVAADVLATPNPAPRVVDALFAAAASTSVLSSRAVGQGAMLPTPVSVGGGSPVRSVGMDVDDGDADAEGEPDDEQEVPLTVTSPSPSVRRSLSNSPSPSRSTTSAAAPTLPELLRAFAQLLSALPPAESAATRAALHCTLRRPPPLPPASSSSPSTAGSLHDFRERAESVRRLRREHVLWARVLSACLAPECTLLPDEDQREWRWFVRGCVKDALVSDDEGAGWLAGAYLLRALRAEEREEGIVRAYEARWRDVRDGRRQSEMGDVMVDLRR